MKPPLSVRHPASTDCSEQGYALLVLLLFMALLVIAAGVAASSLAFTIRRDREEELIHRGVQYTRAIREFTKRTGRFPTRLDELENSNGRRFLRKRYKDPITGKDFKLVYMSEVQMAGNAPLVAPNARMAASTTASQNDQSSNPTPVDSTESNDGSGPRAQTDPQSGATTANFANAGSAQPGSLAQSAVSSNPQILGGLIVGVRSSSRDVTIREFNRKKHYNEWRFYYEPQFDRYFLMNAPTERSALQSMIPGATPVNGQSFGAPAQTSNPALPPVSTPTQSPQE